MQCAHLCGSGHEWSGFRGGWVHLSGHRLTGDTVHLAFGRVLGRPHQGDLVDHVDPSDGKCVSAVLVQLRVPLSSSPSKYVELRQRRVERARASDSYC
jgi:hypothetical protein